MERTRLLAYFLLPVLCFSLIGTARAQDRFRMNLHFVLGFPLGEFRNNLDRNAIGGDISFFYHIPRSVLSTGISLGFLVYGYETREEPLSPTIPDLTVRVTTTNSVLLGHVYLRIQPREGTFRPYLDSLLGFNYLSTDTSVHGRNQSDNALRSNNFNDLALSYGLGGGAGFSIFEVKKKSGGRAFAMNLDLGARWLKGGEAEYLKKGSIRREEGAVIYDKTRSRTDFVKTYLGLSFVF